MSDYFSDQIAQGQPIIPPQAPSVTPVTGTAFSVSDDFKGLPVRAGGDRIFIIKGGKRHWVTSPEAYNNLGFQFGDESRIDQETLDVLKEGEPIK